MRLNRFMALKGLATRRQADELIAAGLVTLDGRKAIIGERVERADQVVAVTSTGGASERDYQYYAYYKPRGIITHSPQRGERSIAIVSGLKKVFPVGRLDKDSEGLIILTNDGRVTERLLGPRFEHEKEYRVTVRELLPSDIGKLLEQGVVEGGEELRAKRVVLVHKHQVIMVLTEGRKHQVRRMLAAIHLTVTQLERIRIMGVHLGSLEPGRYRLLTGKARTGFLAELGLI